MKKKRNKKPNGLTKFIKYNMLLVITYILYCMPITTFAANGTNSFYLVAGTPQIFTGSAKLFAALLTAVLGLVGGYTTIQVVLEWFKYIDAPKEERKLHMQGIKGKAMGGIGAVCTAGVISWALAFYS